MQIIIFVRYPEILDKAQQFFEKYTGAKAVAFRALPQSGSARRNYAASSAGQDYILTYNENLKENESFLYFSEIFSQLKLNTPKIFKISADRTLYLQEYLGSCTLSEIIEKEGLSDRVKLLVQQSLDKLYALQRYALGKVDFTKTFEYETYDELPIQNDLFYFKSFIADVLEIPYHKATLLQEFRHLTSKLAQLQPRGLMIRDFQSRNIIVNDRDEVFFIDYQSAMEGPLMYDVISFLFQAKANFPEEYKNDMLLHYLSKFEDEKDRTLVEQSVKPLQLIRFMQVLGAYGFRGLIQGKAHFVSSLSKGINNLYDLSLSWNEMNDFPELKKLIQNLNGQDTPDRIKNILKK